MMFVNESQHIDPVSELSDLPELGTTLAHELGHFAGMKGHPDQIDDFLLKPTPGIDDVKDGWPNRLMGLFPHRGNLGQIRFNEVAMYQGQWDFHTKDPLSAGSGFPKLIHLGSADVAGDDIEKIQNNSYLFHYAE